MDVILTLSQEFNVNTNIINNIIKLIDDGNTIPFIARYRKEQTGSMDDQMLRDLADRMQYLRNMEAERERIRTVIEEAGKLTEELSLKLDNAKTMSELEDIYLPFRPKRKTRASVARDRGLEPLAEILLKQDTEMPDPLEIAKEYLNDEVPTPEEALQGAMDIIAEEVSFDADLRKRIRNLVFMNGMLKTKANVENIKETVYSMYEEYSEPIKRIANHRLLAINRAEKEEVIKVTIDFDNDIALNIINKVFVKDSSPATSYIKDAAEDGFTRLIFPQIEREIRNDLTDKANESSIKVFNKNLYQLLMQPPLKNKRVLGFDPGYRMGCKLAAVDEKGDVLTTAVIYPVPPFNKTAEAEKIVLKIAKEFNIEIFAIGNGTASHETEEFVASVISDNKLDVSYIVVSESGASVYSASKLAALEFPDFDVNVRSAVSIARRLQDPLAELVKIDPKAIGVGQYQHDMPQARLGEALDGVVEQCVNMVGVELNTASSSLLSRVAGINKTVAQNIIDFRTEVGGFTNRKQLLKVKKLGNKAFEQCAGFLRIRDSENILDNTGVHPESYEPASKLIQLSGDIENIKNFVGENYAAVAEKLNIGVPTLKDIIDEICKPGRDPRDELPKPLLKKEILGIESLKEGMVLDGTVRNVIDFGAFVDIGVHEDGLVHISNMVDRFIKHPSEVVKVGDIIKVKVISVDIAKKRIGLTMKEING